MLRVLVVDDSPTMRELLVAILSSDPGIRVVDTASDGREAIEKASLLRPDLITMDIRMPIVDGVSAIRQIMRDRPAPIVVLCADSNDASLNISFNALKAGALEVVEKPRLSAFGDLSEFGRHLIATVKLMAEVKVVRQLVDESGEFAPLLGLNGESKRKAGPAIDAVGICVSTGGPAALEFLLRRLPATFPAPIAVVQHITEGFLSGLVEWLDGASDLRVKIAQDGEMARPGEVYFAPERQHLVFERSGVLGYSDAPPVRSHKPSGELLFQSIADWYGRRGMGVMLTGMGEDGVDGLAALASCGGVVLAQDEDTSAIFGMPQAVVQRGLESEVVRLEQMPRRMVHWSYGRVGEDG